MEDFISELPNEQTEWSGAEALIGAVLEKISPVYPAAPGAASLLAILADPINKFIADAACAESGDQ